MRNLGKIRILVFYDIDLAFQRVGAVGMFAFTKDEMNDKAEGEYVNAGRDMGYILISFWRAETACSHSN